MFFVCWKKAFPCYSNRHFCRTKRWQKLAGLDSEQIWCAEGGCPGCWLFCSCFANLAAVMFLETVKSWPLWYLNLRIPLAKTLVVRGRHPAAFGFGIMAHYRRYGPMSASSHGDWLSLYDPYDGQDFLEYITFPNLYRRPWFNGEMWYK